MKLFWVILPLLLLSVCVTNGQDDRSIFLTTTTTNYQLSVVSTNLTWILKPKTRNTDLSPHLPPGQFKKLSNLGLYTFQDKENHAHHIITNLLRKGWIQYAERDAIATVNLGPNIPNDPYWTNQYDMPKIGMTNAWNFNTNGAVVVVAVLDTGIDYTHPDLISNLWTDPITGKHGWECNNGVLQQGGAEVYGHGTHVAGTIAARGNNGIGIAGINWTNVQLLSMKFLNGGGFGFLSDAVVLIDQLLTLKSNGVPIYITSNSYGFQGTSTSMAQAMLALEQAGILSVCAAGNSAYNIDLAANAFSPGGLPNRGIISVGASDSNDVIAVFSDFGLVNVDICAPGVNIFSTLPTNTAFLLSNTNGYGFLGGTSMATPHVAGEAALLKSLYPALTVYQLKDTILHRGNYDPMQDATGQFTETGGRINVASALINPYIRSGLTNAPPNATLAPLPAIVTQGTPINFSVSASDQDGDPLRYFIYDLNGAFFNTNSSFTWGSTNWAVDNVVNVQAAVLDGNGGSATGQKYVNLKYNPAFLVDYYSITSYVTLAPSNSGSPDFFPYAISQTDLVTNSKPGVAPRMFLSMCSKGRVNSDWWAITNTPKVELLTDTNGIYDFKIFAINSELSLTNYPGIIFHTGTDNTSTNVLPRLSVKLDATEGIVPFTFNYDAGGSYFPNGFASTNDSSSFFTYFPDPDKQSATYKTPLSGQITVTDPGVHVYQFIYFDWLTLYPDVVSFQIIGLAPFKPLPPTFTGVKLSAHGPVVIQ